MSPPEGAMQRHSARIFGMLLAGQVVWKQAIPRWHGFYTGSEKALGCWTGNHHDQILGIERPHPSNSTCPQYLFLDIWALNPVPRQGVSPHWFPVFVPCMFPPPFSCIMSLLIFMSLFLFEFHFSSIQPLGSQPRSEGTWSISIIDKSLFIQVNVIHQLCSPPHSP